METVLYLVIGLVGGGIAGFVIAKLLQNKSVAKEQYDALSKELVDLKLEMARYVSPEALAESYVTKELFSHVQNALTESGQRLDSERNAVLSLQNQLTELRTEEKNLKEKLELFTVEIDKIHRLSQEQFKNLANTILEEKGQVFVKKNKEELSTILTPLKSDLDTFKKTIEDTRKEDIREMTSLKKEIESLQTMSTQLSEDAQQLAQALKGDSKIQGDWGEDRLRLIIENEGLEKYIDYESQASFIDDDEERRRRTDFIIKLPNGKHIILDSKVSLKDYVDYFNATDPEEKQRSLKKHIDSISKHIENLSSKHYQSLMGVKSADYVFMFMPIENALTIAMNEKPSLFNLALEKKVVLITPMTLVSTMKIVKILWQAENRVKNVELIFSECGKLYDKFAGFLEDFQSLGKNLDDATKAHHAAMNKLKDGAKKGDTIIGRFENIRNLEAKVKKQIPQKYLDEIGYLEEEET
jgi:DNA recombination protein RmuC